MSDFIPKPGAIKIGGLGRKAQKLQAMREKAAQMAQTKNGAKPQSTVPVASFKAKDSFANTKKTTFQRKAV
jgi:hypothetical protein